MDHQARLRLLFIITALDVGGAQAMLWKLLSRIDRQRFEPSVIALSADAVEMLASYRQTGVPCEVLGMKAGLGSAGRILRLAKTIRHRVLGARARQRVIDNFALEAVVRRYENLYTQVNDEYSSKRRT